MEANGELESIQTFIRFISHEMRTPMNIVMMGLDYMEKEFKNVIMTDTDRNKLLHVIQDLKVASRDGVDILDDLLTVDKLERDGLILDKSLISIQPFIESVLQPFFLQVRII